MEYDTNNVFAKILRGELPSKKIYEDDYAIAFHDMYPDAPVHLLVVPKGSYISYSDFLAKASPDEVYGLFKAVANVAKQEGVDGAYRLITNNGEKAGQVVFHFHVHLVAGKPLGPILAK